MNGASSAVLAIVTCACAGVSATAGIYLRGLEYRKARRRRRALGIHASRSRGPSAQSQYKNWTMRYMESLTCKMLLGATLPLLPIVGGGAPDDSRTARWFGAQSVAAGCAKDVNVAAFCEARVRMALMGAAAGALVGAPITVELGVLLAGVGATVGYSLPRRAMRALKRARGACAERHLSEMLEVVSLGLRSGLTFDRSFALYGSHFDNDFAKSCMRAHRRWSLGLASREDCLRELSDSYDCAQLGRVVDSIVRSLRFGSAFTGVLEEAAAQSRASYRTALEERVAKAPVKMMLPTGALILPAMLLLVMGPVLLELVGGF